MIEFNLPRLGTPLGYWVIESTERDTIDNELFYLCSGPPIMVVKIPDNFPVFFDTEDAALDKLIKYYAHHNKTFPAKLITEDPSLPHTGSRELEL